MKYSNIEVITKRVFGEDVDVVNAARVSFGKEHNEFDAAKDERLIRYLAEHDHWSPFAHCFLTVHVKAPIFVARQLVKHQVGLSWNEESRRYIAMDIEPEFYYPEAWREKPTNKKQGSGFNTVEIDDTEVKARLEALFETYKNLLNSGVAPEQARMILPQNMMVNWRWSGSLMAFSRVCNLRCKPDTQLETRLVGFKLSKIIQQEFPVSAKYLLQTDQYA